MRASAPHLNCEAVRRRHQRAGGNAERADRQIRLIVQADHCLHLFQRSAGDDPLGALRLLLGRLEQQPHRSRQRGFLLLQQIRGTEQRRCMEIMPAGMHFSGNL
ncbi:hypothetical protein D3C73_1140150 [compost metagenome]